MQSLFLRWHRMIIGLLMPLSLKGMAEIRPDEHYSINLAWISKTFDPAQRYLYPTAPLLHPGSYERTVSSEEAIVHLEFFAKVFAWAASNPESTVNIWYDSAFVPQKAVETTQAVLMAYAETHPGIASMHVKDIRDLPEVGNNQELFSCGAPLYFRVDLLRLIFSYHAVTHEHYSTAVYQDLDMAPLTKDELFDPSTINGLKKDGFMLARGRENNFMLVCNHNKNLLRALRAFIDFEITATQGKKDPSLTFKGSSIFTHLDPQTIFIDLPYLGAYFILMEKRATLEKNSDEDWQPIPDFAYEIGTGARAIAFLKSKGAHYCLNALQPLDDEYAGKRYPLRHRSQINFFIRCKHFLHHDGADMGGDYHVDDFYEVLHNKNEAPEIRGLSASKLARL